MVSHSYNCQSVGFAVENQEKPWFLRFFLAWPDIRETFLTGTRSQLNSKAWWEATRHLVKQLETGQYTEIQESAMQVELLTLGFSLRDIKKALNWIEIALCSGALPDVSSMLQTPRVSPRVHDQLEQLCVPNEILEKINMFRRNGILGEALSERLLEGVRCADARDWDQDDINSFLKDMIVAAYESSPVNSLDGIFDDPNWKFLLS